jgi:arginase
VGARDLDPAESEYLAGSPTRRVTVPGLSAEVLPPGPLVVHVDLDVIDPASVPGFRFPAPDGPSVEEVLDAFARVLRTGRVVAWDIACPWFPTADEASLQTRMRLLYALTPYLQ